MSRHTHTYKVKNESNAYVDGAQTEVGGTELSIDTSVAANTTNGLIACTIDVSELQSLVLKADKDCTLETNSGSSPAATIALKANVPLVWSKSAGYFANPFGSTDVTAFYLTTGASTTAFEARILTT